MRKEDITYQDKLNELRLDVAHPNSQGLNFIFVEGKSDIQLFRKLFDMQKCKVEKIPGGKISLEKGVAEILDIYSLVVGIRDADFIFLSDQDYMLNNIFLTDFHDIEMTMLSHESILNALLFEYTNHSVGEHLEIRYNIMKSIEMISYLKWLNKIENLQLDFSSGFQDLISFDQFNVDFDQYLQRVISKSENAIINNEEIIKNKINDLMETHPDYLQLTNGHDLLKAFATYFREVFSFGGLKDENLACALRMSFNSRCFSETNLYGSLKGWESDNNTQIFLS